MELRNKIKELQKKNISELTKLVNMMEIDNLFIYITYKLRENRIDQKTYIKTVVLSDYNIMTIPTIKQIIARLRDEDYKYAYNFLLISYMKNKISIKINKYKKILDMKKDDNTVFKKYIQDRVNIINAFPKMSRKLLNEQGKLESIDPISKNNRQYSDEEIENMWIAQNKAEVIDRLILIVERFGYKIIDVVNCKKITMETANNMVYKDLVSYYNKIVQNIYEYYNKIDINMNIYEHLIDMHNKLIDNPESIADSRYEHILKLN